MERKNESEKVILQIIMTYLISDSFCGVEAVGISGIWQHLTTPKNLHMSIYKGTYLSVI